jgi:hypothetical protein
MVALRFHSWWCAVAREISHKRTQMNTVFLYMAVRSARVVSLTISFSIKESQYRNQEDQE